MPRNQGVGIARAIAPSGTPGSAYEYDVAISYAREDVRIADALAAELERAGVRVFYDRHERAKLWGVRLDARLGEIYAEHARFVVILASRHYGKRRWTVLERSIARRRARHEGGRTSILPIAIGTRSVPGLPTAIAHVSLEGGIGDVVTLLLEKLRTTGSSIPRLAPVPAEDATHMNMQSHHPHMPAYPRDPQPMHMQGRVSPGGTVVAKTSHVDSGNVNAGDLTMGGRSENIIGSPGTVTINKNQGIGAFGLTSVVLAVGTALCGMGWLAFDFVRDMPRNSDGSVTMWGVFTLPASIVGEPTTNGPAEAPHVPKSIPGAPTREQLEGVWRCDKNATVTFTETGRVALKNDYGYAYPNTAFATWRDEPYEFASPRTIVVGGNEANIELSKDERSLRIFGGKHIFECTKDTF